ncbi:MAG: DUF2244 domain-containing protein [Acetobacteraceae bacterium]
MRATELGAAPPAERVVFEAVIVPHRSLSRHGFYWLIGVLCGLSSLVTFLCWQLGAWPVAGFSAAEIVLALLLVHWHGESGRRESELLLLSEQGLIVRRSRRGGGLGEQKVLPVQWLRVVLEERRGRVPGLFLKAHGVSEEVARSLGEEEKRDLASALTAAFDRMRHPVFDNPQLIDPPRASA